MSLATEKLQHCLAAAAVPPVWLEAATYPSLRTLPGWVEDLDRRCAQMELWSRRPMVVPSCTWISGLLNPQAFLTAIMQQDAHENVTDLDRLYVRSELTKKLDPSDFPAAARDGQYAYGLVLEGARYTLGTSTIEALMPRQMGSPLPVVNLKPVVLSTAPKAAAAAGGGGDEGGDAAKASGPFDCPVYKTQQRGATYVFSVALRGRHPPAKWILAGAAILMDPTT